MRCSIILIALLGLAGCVTMTPDPRFVGTYTAADSESLIFQRDAGVYFSRVVGGREQRVFVGYYGAVSSSPAGSLSFCGPDTSAFIGTSFQFSDDFRMVTAHWGSLIGSEYRPKQIQFHRRISGYPSDAANRR